MPFLLDVLPLLLCVAVVGAVVWIGLLLATHGGPGGPNTEPAPKPSRRQRLVGVLHLVVCFVLQFGATAAQTAYGAPVGQQTSPTVEVLEVGECSRPVGAFGLVVSCEISGYWYPNADGWLMDGPGAVLSAEAVEPGDRVAEFTPSGWTKFLQPLPTTSKWRPIEDAEKPDLRWLPAAALVAGIEIAYLIHRWRRSRSGEVDPDQALRGSG